MKNLRKNLFFVASISIWMVIVTACTDYEPPKHDVPDGVKAYFNFKVGTYWVMKDSMTGMVDSFYESGSAKSYSGKNEELITINIPRTYLSSELALYFDPTSVTLSFRKGSSIATIFYAITINYPFSLGVHNGYNNQYELLYYPKMIVGGVTRDSVYVACCNSSAPYNTYDDTVCFNRSAGFLQFKLNNTNEKHNWILQSQTLIR